MLLPMGGENSNSIRSSKQAIDRDSIATLAFGVKIYTENAPLLLGL
ncbi:MAG: hypothetical protein ACMG55_19895 [Microcoleus sp.]